MNLKAMTCLNISGRENRSRAATARRLVRRLREISEASVAAGWLNDLEYLVWQDMTDRRLVANLLVSPEGDVFPPLDEEEKRELRRLSEVIEGWVIYDGQDEEDQAAFVPLADWIARFEVWFNRTEAAVVGHS